MRSEGPRCWCNPNTDDHIVDAPGMVGLVFKKGHNLKTLDALFQIGLTNEKAPRFPERLAR
jgi:hypothetical protein